MARNTKRSNMERRVFTHDVELRDLDGTPTIAGYAAVFNRRSHDLGGFIEQIAPTAFRRTLAEQHDVVALVNHDENRVIGRTSAGTLTLSTDEVGLRYQVRLGNQSYATDLAETLRRGDIRQSSFAFIATQDSWDVTDEGAPLRTLLEVKLFDVSAVTQPAYPDSTVGIDRSLALSGLARRSKVTVVELASPDAILRAVRGEPVAKPVDRRALELRRRLAKDLRKLV